MSIAGYNQKITTVVLPDPAADATVLALVAPAPGFRLESARAFTSAAIASDPTNWIEISLLDGGQDGTGSTSMGSYGGASTAWNANQGHALTLTQADLDAGDHLLLKYDENGAVAPGNVGIVLIWVASE